MISLIYGDDEYRISRFVKEARKDFGEGNDLNISHYEGELDFPTIKADAETMPFLASKKLIIVKGLSKIKVKQTQKDILSWFTEPPASCDVLLVEGELTAKNWLLAGAKGKAQIQNLSKLKPYEINRWIKETVVKKEGEITPEAAEKLAALIGNDLWRLDNEIQKLITYNKKITLENVNNIVKGEFQDNIFVLMDALSEKKLEKALSTITNFLDSDDNEVYLLTMLARQVRNLLSIKDLAGRGSREAEIATKLKLHPYVVKNTLRQSRNFTFNQLLALHTDLVEIDYNLKTSNADSKTALTQFAYRACKK